MHLILLDCFAAAAVLHDHGRWNAYLDAAFATIYTEHGDRVLIMLLNRG